MKKTGFLFIIVLSMVSLLISCGSPCSKGHTWINATCTTPKICSVCGTTEGDALGHAWISATCTAPETCSVCGESNGSPRSHNVEEYYTISEATCSSAGEKQGVCTDCGKTISVEIEKIPHTQGQWEIALKATQNSSGTKVLKCAICDETMETVPYTMTAEEIKSDYISKCSKYSYKEISRNPDNYKGKYAALKGEVIQVIEDGNTYTLRVDITKNKYYWSDTILVTYTKIDKSEPRILEDDIVNMYGMLGGTYTYETVMGSKLTVPILYAKYIDIN